MSVKEIDKKIREIYNISHDKSFNLDKLRNVIADQVNLMYLLNEDVKALHFRVWCLLGIVSIVELLNFFERFL